MNRFLFGFSAYFRGLRMWIGDGSLLRLSVIPFFLDLVCLGAGIYYTFTHVSTVVSYFAHSPHIWYQYFYYALLYLVVALCLFFVVIFVVFIFANLIVFPFNDRLAERTLRLHGLQIESSSGTRAWVGKSIRNTAAMLEKAVILLGAGSLLTAVTLLIPGFGLLAAAAGVFLMACDRLDYAFDQYQLTLRARFSFIRAHFPEIVGFSAALGLTTALPVINIVLMPGGVVSGASLVARLSRSK